MNFWEFMDNQIARLPGWPTEKQLVMLTTFGMGFTMLVMARYDSALWTIELFKTLITVVIVTGCVNMMLAHYFTTNKNEENRAELDKVRVETTNEAFKAITATAQASSGMEASGILKAGDEVVLEKP